MPVEPRALGMSEATQEATELMGRGDQPRTEKGAAELTMREASLPAKLRAWREKLSVKAKQETVNASRNKAMRKPDAGNLHVRFDEGEGTQRSLASKPVIPCVPLYSTGCDADDA